MENRFDKQCQELKDRLTCREHTLTRYIESVAHEFYLPVERAEKIVHEAIRSEWERQVSNKVKSHFLNMSVIELMTLTYQLDNLPIKEPTIKERAVHNDTSDQVCKPQTQVADNTKAKVKKSKKVRRSKKKASNKAKVLES